MGIFHSHNYTPSQCGFIEAFLSLETLMESVIQPVVPKRFDKFKSARYRLNLVYVNFYPCFLLNTKLHIKNNATARLEFW